MADERKGAYAEVEGLKKGKFKIARDYRRLELILSIFISVIFLFLFSGDIFSTEMLYISIFSGLSDNYKGKFNYPIFAAIYIPLLFGAYLFFNGRLFTDKKGFIGKITTKQRKFGSFIIHTIFRYDKKKDTMSFLDILDTPFRILNTTLFYVPNDLRPKIGLRIGYIDHLHKNFFNQTVEKEDGYSRVKELVFFKSPEYIFGKNYYDSVRSLFKDEKSFKDLLMIIEGYLVEGKLYDTRLENPLKDDLFTDDYYKKYKWFIIMNKLHEAQKLREDIEGRKKRSDELEAEFIQKHKDSWQAELAKIESELKKRNYKYFVSYMLRPNAKGELVDNVTLSRASIRYYLEDNCVKFKKFLEENLYNNNTNSNIYKGLLELADDIHFRDKLVTKRKPLKELTADEKDELLRELDKLKELSASVKAIEHFSGLAKEMAKLANQTMQKHYNEKVNKEKIEAGVLSKDGLSKAFKNRIIEMLMADFCLVMFRMVMGQYMNLPAGTMVVKIDSYDTRVIIEYYKQQSTINIEEKRNDGTSKLFNSDRYANLFFQCFWLFCNENPASTFGQLNFRFNTSETAKPHTFEYIAKSIDEKGVDTTAKEQAKEEVENRKIKETDGFKNNAEKDTSLNSEAWKEKTDA